MLKVLTGLAFSMLVSYVQAQEQDGKLVDRLLRPDVTLQNSAQGKQFTAGGALVEKRATTKDFHFRQKQFAKNFAGDRTYATKEFAAQEFPQRDTKANVPSTGWAANARKTYGTRPAWAIGAAPDGDKLVHVTQFRTRPFLGRGKSQKALSQQDTPLTIDQVRELLNKNK